MFEKIMKTDMMEGTIFFLKNGIVIFILDNNTVMGSRSYIGKDIPIFMSNMKLYMIDINNFETIDILHDGTYIKFMPE